MFSLNFYVTVIKFKIFVLNVNLYAEVMKAFNLGSCHIFTKSTLHKNQFYGRKKNSFFSKEI
jgi:hypothetical protein